MKHIFLNLKRFDIPTEKAGVNAIAPVTEWGSYIIHHIQEPLEKYRGKDVEFVIFFPEAHILTASAALKPDSMVKLGCQSIYRADTEKGKNFGAFTGNRTGNAMVGLGCKAVLIGHCEERMDKAGVLKEAGCTDAEAVNRILNQEILAAQRAGLEVLYCIGERAEEQENWQEVLEKQLTTGLAGADLTKVTIGYEPVWAIGPGKTPPGKEYMEMIGKYIKKVMGDVDVVYGGGLKKENAAMVSSVAELDGVLIALTRFQGEIGFYPEEYLEIIDKYMGE